MQFAPRTLTVMMALVMAAHFGLTGCSTTGEGAKAADSYAEALRVCRFKANGNRAARRNSLPAENPRVASCLTRAGWDTNGKRLSSFLGTQTQ
jgi:hypothetical protein